MENIFDEMRSLIIETKNNCFMQLGIKLPEDNYIIDKDNIVSENSADKLSIFCIKQDKIAFYNEINSSHDIDKIFNNLYDKLKQFSDDIKNYRARNSSSIKIDMLGKLNKLKTEVDRSLTALESRNTKLKKSCEQCTDIDSTIEKIAEMYQAFFKEKIFNPIVIPLYKGYIENCDSSYEWLITKINGFFSTLGIYTLEIKVGDRIEFNNELNVPYDLIEPMEDNSDLSTDIAKKDIVKDIMRYAYVFNDDKENSRVVMEGQLRIWRYK